MGSFRFLLSRRWALFALVVVVLSWLAWALGQWQFSRLEERQERNAIVERNTALPPVPVEELMTVGEPIDAEDEWRRVTATGRYAADETIVVRYRTRESTAGVNLVVPLVTADGTAVLVDRGWMQADNRGVPSDVPTPAETEVTMTGWVRIDATGNAIRVSDQSTRAISSSAIGEALDRSVYAGFVQLESESPSVGSDLAPALLPELDGGPHFFYGLQWWFFGALALFGFGYLAYDERRKGGPASARLERFAREQEGTDPDGAGSEGAQHPAVDREHHTAHEG